MNSSRDAGTVQPLLDTWRRFKYAASWMWAPSSRPSSDEARPLNSWGTSQLTDVLEVLRPIARVRTALLEGRAEAPFHTMPRFTWNERNTSHAGFELSLLEFVREASNAITSVEMTFDLYVWVHTANVNSAVRGWVRNTADVCLQLEVHNPYGVLSMDHTLFRDGATHGDSNSELHRLNNPLLKEALAAIAARLGPIVEVEGLPDVTRTGFKTLG